MEEIAGENARRGAVQPVSNHGVADAGEMHADLVGAAGADANFQQSELIETLEHTIFGEGRAPASQPGSHADAMQRMTGNGRGDPAALRFQAAVHERDVDLFDLPRGELLRQVAVGGVRPGDQDDPAGKAIQPVDDPGP